MLLSRLPKLLSYIAYSSTDCNSSGDEDTDDASETDNAVKKEEHKIEIKEQMYREKLQQINQLRKQLQNETLPEYCRKQKKLDQTFKDRQRQIKAYHEYLLAKVHTYISITFFLHFSPDIIWFVIIMSFSNISC